MSFKLIYNKGSHLSFQAHVSSGTCGLPSWRCLITQHLSSRLFMLLHTMLPLCHRVCVKGCAGAEYPSSVLFHNAGWILGGVLLVAFTGKAT